MKNYEMALELIESLEKQDEDVEKEREEVFLLLETATGGDWKDLSVRYNKLLDLQTEISNTIRKLDAQLTFYQGDDAEPTARMYSDGLIVHQSVLTEEIENFFIWQKLMMEEAE